MNVVQLLKPIPNLKIIVLENPYAAWTVPSVPDLFKYTVELKRLGYEGYYPVGFLPVDTLDLVATHLLICEETDEGFIPIAGYRSITESLCRFHHLTFPPVAALMKNKGVELHQQALNEILNESALKRENLSYGGAWTIHPRIKEDRAKVNLMKDIARALMFFHQTEFKVDSELGFASTKVKTDVYFSELGYESVSLDGNTLPPFEHVEIGTLILIHRKKFTSLAEEAAKRHQNLWESKLHFYTSPAFPKKKVA